MGCFKKNNFENGTKLPGMRLKPLGHLSIINHYLQFSKPQKKRFEEFQHYQNCFILFFPFFCFSKSFFFLLTSPPYNFAVTSFLNAFIVSRAIILP